jgi:hypothetical protein
VSLGNLENSDYESVWFSRDTIFNYWQRDSSSIYNLDRGLVFNNTGSRKFAQLAYPLEFGKSWNAGAFSNRDSSIYFYEEIFQDTILQDSISAITHLVNEGEFFTLISRDSGRSIYAEDIGMVFHEKVQLDLAASFTDSISAGSTKKLTAIDWGILEEDSLLLLFDLNE